MHLWGRHQLQTMEFLPNCLLLRWLLLLLLHFWCLLCAANRAAERSAGGVGTLFVLLLRLFLRMQEWRLLLLLFW